MPTQKYLIWSATPDGLDGLLFRALIKTQRASLAVFTPSSFFSYCCVTPILLSLEHMGKCRVKNEVKAKACDAKAVPASIQELESKEPTTFKQKQRASTMLGLRKIGAPAVGAPRTYKIKVADLLIY